MVENITDVRHKVDGILNESVLAVGGVLAAFHLLGKVMNKIAMHAGAQDMYRSGYYEDVETYLEMASRDSFEHFWPDTSAVGTFGFMDTNNAMQMRKAPENLVAKRGMKKFAKSIEALLGRYIVEDWAHTVFERGHKAGLEYLEKVLQERKARLVDVTRHAQGEKVDPIYAPRRQA